jgi:hypothetical protein
MINASNETRKRLKNSAEQLLRELATAGVTDTDGVFAVHIKDGAVTVEAVPVDERKKARRNAAESDEGNPAPGSE